MFLKEHEYIRQTLERYTGSPLSEFCEFFLITNFRQYIHKCREKYGGVYYKGNFRTLHIPEKNCTVIDFGIGSPQAALLVHCLAYLDNLKAVVMLGMCGGIDDSLEIGNFIVPTAAIRGEGTSRHYLPPEFPAIPASSVNLFCIGALKKRSLPSRCGIVYTTDRRLWEFDQTFVEYLKDKRILAIDMELATLFTVAYRYEVPIGSIMLVSDMPLHKGGIKDKELTEYVFSHYTELHLELGMDAIENLHKKWSEVERSLKSEW